MASMPQACVSHFWTKSATLSYPFLYTSVVIFPLKTSSFCNLLISVWVFHGPDGHNGLSLDVSVLNQFQTMSNSEKQVAIPMSWFPHTMGKTGQGFLLPLTHPFSQHRPQDSSLHRPSQSHSHLQFTGCLSLSI